VVLWFDGWLGSEGQGCWNYVVRAIERGVNNLPFSRGSIRTTPWAANLGVRPAACRRANSCPTDYQSSRSPFWSQPSTLLSNSLQRILNAFRLKMVRLACTRCPRKGQYRKATLIQEYGAAISLPTLRLQIAKCEHDGKLRTACGGLLREFGVEKV